MGPLRIYRNPALVKQAQGLSLVRPLHPQNHANGLEHDDEVSA